MNYFLFLYLKSNQRPYNDLVPTIEVHRAHIQYINKLHCWYHNIITTKPKLKLMKQEKRNINSVVYAQEIHYTKVYMEQGEEEKNVI